MATTSVEFDESLFYLSDPGQAYLSPSNQHNYQKLIGGIQEGKKLLLITGEAGCGKSTLVRRAAHELGEAVRLISIHRGDLDFEAVVDYISKELGGGSPNEGPLTDKIAFLAHLLREQPAPHVIILIDQAENMELDVIRDILALGGAQPGNALFVHIVLIGLPGFANLLDREGLRDSEQEMVCHCRLQRLGPDEVMTYINFYLSRLQGRGRNLFSDEALKRVVFYSRGVPRLINRLCGLGLLAASLEDKQMVTPAMIDEVSESCLSLASEIDYVAPPPADTFNDAPAEVPSEHFADSLEPTEILGGTDEEATLLRGDADSETVIKPLDPTDWEEATQIIPPRAAVSVDKPPKTRFISAFALGILVSVLAGTGLFFLFGSDEDAPIGTLAKKEAGEAPVVARRQLPEIPPERPWVPEETPQRQEPVSTEAPVVSESPVDAAENLAKQEARLKAQRISALLANAQTQLAKKQLLTPIGDNAWESYREILDLAPEHKEALAGIAKIKETYVLWARNEVKQGHLELAEHFYRKVLQVAPGDPGILAAINELKGEQLAGRQERASVATAEFSPTDPANNTIEKLLDQAEQQLAAKNLMTPVEDSAWSTYQEILAAAPGHKEALAGVEKIKDTYALWARHEIKKGNSKHAAYLYGKALEVSPDNPEIQAALNRLGETQDLTGLEEVKSSYVRWARDEIVKGNYERAEYHYQKALEVFPADPGILSALARVRKMRSDTGNNPSDAKAAKFQEPDTGKQGIDQLLRFAEQQIVRKHLTKPAGSSALSVYQTILDRAPGHEKAIAGIEKIKETYTLWARHEISKGNYRHAEYLYRKALEVSPSDRGIIFELDRLMQTQGKGRPGQSNSRVKVKVHPKAPGNN